MADDILASLSVEAVGDDRFDGRSPSDSPPRIYGGQVVAQAMAAAEGTVGGGRIHSVHAGFLAAGDPMHPIRYEVARLRDGRSYSSRHVVARQEGNAIFQAAVAFHVGDEPEPYEHQDPLEVVVPPPDELPSVAQLFDAWGVGGPRMSHMRLVDVRPSAYVDPVDPQPLPPDRACWFRIPEALPDDAATHVRAIAFGSDVFLMATAMMPHAIVSGSSAVRFASLDHTVWFHHPARADEWLLQVMHSPAAAAGRGLARGSIYDGAGRLVASTAQEGVIRRARP